MNIIQALEQEQLRSDIPEFRPGDTVRVHVKVVEGSRERIQAFEGVVITRQSGGVRETFTVRRVSYGVGVERIFPLFSPVIDKVEIVKRARARRSKLYYVREKAVRDVRRKMKQVHVSSAGADEATEEVAETTEA